MQRIFLVIIALLPLFAAAEDAPALLGRLERLVRSPPFEMFFTFLIFVSVMTRGEKQLG